MRSVRLPACAKVNLCLRVLGRRADGYHELRTIFQTISLHDTLELELTRARSITLECDYPGLSTGRDNLVWRAIAAMQHELGLRNGVHARLEKLIPVGRGLGGGSADAAAAMMGMLRLAGRAADRIPPARMIAIGASLGADVPFFFRGGRAVGVGRGDEIYPLTDIRKRSVLVVSPAGIAVNTREAYGWLRPYLTKRRKALKISSFCALCWSLQSAGLENDFEPAVFARHPRLARIKRVLLQKGAQEAALAGSGSAVFGIYQHPAQARRAAQSFPGDATFVVETLSSVEYRKALGL
jgi:4-diphosphocytidyl-2-C-methyl-D-erythritol kinase